MDSLGGQDIVDQITTALVEPSTEHKINVGLEGTVSYIQSCPRLHLIKYSKLEEGQGTNKAKCLLHVVCTVDNLPTG